MSVRENVCFGLPRGAGTTLVDRAVELLEIGHLLDRRTDRLSGGEKQRAALARALAAEPDALLLDEPLASLDLPLRARIFPYLLRLRDVARVPMIYVTHDAAEALAIASHVLVLENGRIVASGSTDEMLPSSAALRLPDLVELENRLPVVRIEPDATSAVVRLRTHNGLTLIAPSGFRVEPGEVVGIRAEDILVAAQQASGLSAQNVLLGTILSIKDRAGRVLVSVACGQETLEAAITHHAATDLGLREGRQVWLIFKAHSIHRLGAGSSVGLGRPTRCEPVRGARTGGPGLPGMESDPHG